MQYLDTADAPEDDRIELIGKTAMKATGTIAFIVDDEPDKPERYIRKLLAKFPELEVDKQMRGPVKDAITVTIRRRYTMNTN